MFVFSLGDFAFRRVSNHRTHRSLVSKINVTLDITKSVPLSSGLSGTLVVYGVLHP